MFAEVEKFFTAILGDGVDVTLIHAFLICLSVLIVYAFILRPFINLVGGKNGSRIFDLTVMILIVLVGVKTLYPDIFTEGGYTKTDLDSYYDQGYSDGYDRGEGEGYDKGYADGLKESAAEEEPDLPVYDSVDAAGTAIYGANDPDADFTSSYVTQEYYPYFYGDTEIYINAQTFTVILNGEPIEVSSDMCECDPAFIVDGETYYHFPLILPDRVDDCFYIDFESNYKYLIPASKVSPM